MCKCMNYYFLGIGGIGMSALARYFHLQGHQVSGYDRTPSPLTQQLEAEGIPVHYNDDPALIPEAVDLVVYTPAVPVETAEYQHLLQKGVPIKKRSQVLGEVTRGKKCIAVAGTHGKTSTSSMIAHLLSHSPLGCSAFLGGIAKNFGSNIVVPDGKASGTSEYVVVEADEYDRSFLQLHPYCAVITATDADHLDIYGTRENLLEAFHQFAQQISPDGALVIKQGVALTADHHHHDHEEEEEHEHHDLKEELQLLNSQFSILNYTAHGIEADYYPWNVRNYGGNIFFDLRTPKGVYYDIELPESPLYNVENAVAAAAVALTLGLDEYQLRHGLKTYKGVRRRFDYRIKTKDLIYIDDYAHHPQEIAACLDSIRYLYPGKRVVGIFQPHLYTRTRDFADQFAEVLGTLDELIMLPIYPAREKPIAGVTSAMVLRKVAGMSKYLCTPDQVLELVPALCPDIVVTMGAGDIDRLVPRLEETLRAL
ncbi:MAG: UDP-N-acetylmuramate--L-alanine ligase [Bacteroidales bacterium]|nr:UDP-N-acetylmuramate--L-alanine ligase [Bacteroidales bacterium]